MRAVAALGVALLFLPFAAAQPGIDLAITDGVPFELDGDATLAALDDMKSRLSGQSIHDCVAEITKDLPAQYRVMGTPTHDLFIERYATVFRDLGLETGLQYFDEGSAIGIGAVTGEGGVNIIGALPGRDLHKWIVVGGHHDTRELTVTGGALDNASGICSVLELAEATVAYTEEHGTLEASVVFAWYDGEEWGLYGARAFAQDLNFTKDLLGVPHADDVDVMVSQSFDMPGINWPARNLWVQYDKGGDEQLAVLNLRTAPWQVNGDETWLCPSYACYEELKQHPDFESIVRRNANYQFLVREVAHDYLQGPPGFVWVYDDNYGRSDHMPLIAQGSAGMRIQGSHDEEYPCYHQPCDTLEWLYVQTGSQEELIQAYDMEIWAGGLTAFYTALHGDVGRYADKHVFDEAPEPRSYHGDDGDDDKDTPAPFALLPIAFAAALLVRRKR